MKDLVNWGELSRRLTGSRLNVRRNRIPKKYEPVIKDLTEAMERILSKFFDKAEQGGKKNKNTCTTDK